MKGKKTIFNRFRHAPFTDDVTGQVHDYVDRKIAPDLLKDQFDFIKKSEAKPGLFTDTGKGILVDDELMDASLLLALGAGGLGANHLLFGNKKKSQEETKAQQITQMKYAPYMK